MQYLLSSLIVKYRVVIGSGRPMERSILFSEALLVAVSFEKAGVPLSELGVGHIGIDILLHEQLHVLLGVKAAVGGELGFLEYVRRCRWL